MIHMFHKIVPLISITNNSIALFGCPSHKNTLNTKLVCTLATSSMFGARTNASELYCQFMLNLS